MRKPERVELCEGAWLDLWPRLVDGHEGWLERLVAELPLASETYTMFGRTVPSPRLVAWHGDPDAGYVYSGMFHEPQPWTPGLTALREVVETTSGLTFDAVLANLYRDGADGMGWHADDEVEIGPSPEDRWVASLSLGAPRRFVLRRRSDRAKWERPLGEGDLLVMRGTTQTHYQHAAPKTKRPVGRRLNLTFRRIRD